MTSMSYRHNDISSETAIKNRGILRGSHSGHFFTTCFTGFDFRCPDTRVAGKYRHEITENDHRKLVACLISLRGMVVLSGYAHPTYKPLGTGRLGADGLPDMHPWSGIVNSQGRVFVAFSDSSESKKAKSLAHPN